MADIFNEEKKGIGGDGAAVTGIDNATSADNLWSDKQHLNLSMQNQTVNGEDKFTIGFNEEEYKSTFLS